MTTTEPIIVTITGRTCSGKSTLEQALVNTGKFEKVISYTTRQPRPGEFDGVDYYFVSEKEFEMLQEEKGFFVETTCFGGNYYGASKSEFGRILGLGKHAVVVVEPNGRNMIHHFCRTNDLLCLSVFVTVTGETLANRFLHRALEDVFRAGIKLSDAQEIVEAEEVVLGRYAKRLGTILDVEQYWTQPTTNSSGDVVQLWTVFGEGDAEKIAKGVDEVIEHGWSARPWRRDLLKNPV